MSGQKARRPSGRRRKTAPTQKPTRAASRQADEDTRIRELEARIAELEAAQAPGSDSSERPRGVDVLRESEGLLWLSRGAGEAGAWEWIPRTGAFNRTPELDRLYGMTPDAVRTYQEWRQLTHPGDMARVEAGRDQAIARRKSFNFEFRILDTTEQVRWINDRGSAIYDEAGEVVRVLGVSVDITERKQAEELMYALSWIDEITSLAPEVNEIVQGTLTVAARAVRSDTAAIALRRDDRWVVSHVYGFQQDLVGFPMTDEDEPHAVLAADTKQPVLIDDAFNDPRVNRRRMTQRGIRSALVVPLIAGGETIGVIFFNQHQSAFAFDDSHAAFAARLVTPLALALEKSRLVQNLQTAVAERTRVERELAEANERLQALVNGSA